MQRRSSVAAGRVVVLAMILLAVLGARSTTHRPPKHQDWRASRAAHGDPNAQLTVTVSPARVGTNEVVIELEHPALDLGAHLFGSAVVVDGERSVGAKLGPGVLPHKAFGSVVLDHAGSWTLTADIYGDKAGPGIYGLRNIVFDVPIASREHGPEPILAIGVLVAGMAVMAGVAAVAVGVPRRR